MPDNNEAMPPRPDDHEVYGRAPGTGDWRRLTRLTALVVLVAFAVLFFLLNRSTVEVSLVVTTVNVPLVWMLLLSFFLGATVMYLWLYLRRRAVRKTRRSG
jgi:uncharacterized integral membrane protein